MASQLSLPTPPPLDLRSDPNSAHAKWRKWLAQFQLFAVAANITDKARLRQLLLYTAGEDLQAIAAGLTETGEKSIDTLVNALNEHFTSKLNVPLTRYQFRLCTQRTGEALDDWLRRLNEAADCCSFDTLRDSLIRDQLIAGCGSEQLRRKLLAMDNVSLDQAVRVARAMETAEALANIMESSEAAVQRLRRQEAEPRPPALGVSVANTHMQGQWQQPQQQWQQQQQAYTERQATKVSQPATSLSLLPRQQVARPGQLSEQVRPGEDPAPTPRQLHPTRDQSPPQLPPPLWSNFSGAPLQTDSVGQSGGFNIFGNGNSVAIR